MGPLTGTRIVEIAGIGPTPFAAMLLSDLGAEVIRVDRIHPGLMSSWENPKLDVMSRGRRMLAVDLKQPAGVELVLDLIATSDALIEGFRPGVAERLGIGPEACLQRNARLVYGRMTGWGQAGPLAESAGHDINYISLTGALHAIGEKGGRPVPPLNLVGDFGGGSLYLCLGVVAAMFEAARSGRGQVVDAAMVDGASSLMAPITAAVATGFWKTERGSNLLDGGAPFYRTYETKDGEYMAVGAIEPQFYVELIKGLGLVDADLPDQHDTDRWEELHARFADVFATRTRAEWEQVFFGTDACVSPVIDLRDAPKNDHMAARQTFLELDGVVQPAPAPRFSRTAAEIRHSPRHHAADTVAVLEELGYDADRRQSLLEAGVIKQREESSDA